MPFNVAVAVSYKFEDVNLLLEILKLNFKEPPIIHVFCNASPSVFTQCGGMLNMTLIDHFYHIPDVGCYPDNPSRDTKRQQPLDMFRYITSHLAGLKEDFVFLEGDCYPLSEKEFYEPFEGLSSVDCMANFFDFALVDITKHSNQEHIDVLATTISQIHKMPYGYIYPGGMYFTHEAAGKIATCIKDYRSFLLDGTKNFEGCLGVVFASTKITRKNYSNVFCYTYPKTNQLDPFTQIIHQHNIFNLRDEFLARGIDKGRWVQRVLNESSYKRIVDGLTITKSDIPVEVCTLRL